MWLMLFCAPFQNDILTAVKWRRLRLELQPPITAVQIALPALPIPTCVRCQRITDLKKCARYALKWLFFRANVLTHKSTFALRAGGRLLAAMRGHFIVTKT
ncbi:hypothetical protein [Hyphomicrobium sp. D-2]|uniref:hypothetical protein n=1 Tax=Hyphomicrobium sp. D-2 TaxID=3041621 RepID=UPI002456AB5F|nr:hypothetical protein [Hyphomicrobium sp. D-2]MDH4981027.1 hypothetical protein [Hyphomicrobium sp. D-2]